MKIKLRAIGSNQTELDLGNATVLFSYDQPVAAFKPGLGYFVTARKWSATTTRHVNQWTKGGKVTTMPQDWFDTFLVCNDPVADAAAVLAVKS